MEMLQKIRSNTDYISNLDMLYNYVDKNESNKIGQDNKQDKETKYHRDDQNTNNIFDKDELDQDHNEIQASIVDNKDNPYNKKYMYPTVCQGIQVRQIKYHIFIIYLNSFTTLEKPKCNTTW